MFDGLLRSLLYSLSMSVVWRTKHDVRLLIHLPMSALNIQQVIVGPELNQTQTSKLACGLKAS